MLCLSNDSILFDKRESTEESINGIGLPFLGGRGALLLCNLIKGDILLKELHLLVGPVNRRRHWGESQRQGKPIDREGGCLKKTPEITGHLTEVGIFTFVTCKIASTTVFYSVVAFFILYFLGNQSLMVRRAEGIQNMRIPRISCLERLNSISNEGLQDRFYHTSIHKTGVLSKGGIFSKGGVSCSNKDDHRDVMYQQLPSSSQNELHTLMASPSEHARRAAEVVIAVLLVPALVFKKITESTLTIFFRVIITLGLVFEAIGKTALEHIQPRVPDSSTETPAKHEPKAPVRHPKVRFYSVVVGTKVGTTTNR